MPHYSSPNLNIHLHLSSTLVLCLVVNVNVLYICGTRLVLLYTNKSLSFRKINFRLPSNASAHIKEYITVIQCIKRRAKTLQKQQHIHTHTTHFCHLLVGGSGGFADCVPCVVCFPASACMHRKLDAWRPGYATTYWHERSYHIH